MRRRATIEPVVGHLKDDIGCAVKGRNGDRINAVLAAAGYNFTCSCAGSRSFYAPRS
jgi:transposase, IS5 family